jgi:hypothetical protein
MPRSSAQVQDNLNTYLPGSLYDTFAPTEARRQKAHRASRAETTSPRARMTIHEGSHSNSEAITTIAR